MTEAAAALTLVNDERARGWTLAQGAGAALGGCAIWGVARSLDHGLHWIVFALAAALIAALVLRAAAASCYVLEVAFVPGDLPIRVTRRYPFHDETIAYGLRDMIDLRVEDPLPWEPPGHRLVMEIRGVHTMIVAREGDPAALRARGRAIVEALRHG